MGIEKQGIERQGPDLFGKVRPAAPLAERLRPRTLDDVVGQKHLLGPGKPLRAAFESGKPHSMILWGPPGSGKTTLARLIEDMERAGLVSPMQSNGNREVLVPAKVE